MTKLIPLLGLVLGMLAGLLWPINNNPNSTLQTQANTPPQDRPILVEVLASRWPAFDDQKTPPQPAIDKGKGVDKTSPTPTPTQTPTVATTADVPKPVEPPPPVAKVEVVISASIAAPEPKIRIIRGQLPEDVLRQLRPQGPLFSDRQTEPKKVTKTPPRPEPAPKPPTPNPKPQPVNGNYCYLAYGYKDWPTDTAFAVCMGESGGRPKAVNSSDKHANCNGSYGLFQIACFWAKPSDMLNPEKNVAKAFEIYQHSGWQPWSAYKNGSYRRYLPN